MKAALRVHIMMRCTTLANGATRTALSAIQILQGTIRLGITMAKNALRATRPPLTAG